ncbi:MAG: DUF6515 family protein [Candidatus Omnitrophota bacterium]
MTGRGKCVRIIIIFSVMMIFLQPTLSFAQWHGREDRHDRYYHYHDRPRFGMRMEVLPYDYVVITAGGARYSYYDGGYYAPTRNGYVLVEPPIGALVPVIPAEYRPVIINGVTYYTDSGVYYVYTRHGYQVVPPPLVQRISDPVVIQAERPVQVIPEPQNQTKVVEGSVMGGVLGALAGGIIGHQMKGHHELGGALIGGAAGAAMGGIAGAQIPNQDVALTPAAVVPSAQEVAVPVFVDSPVVQPGTSAPQGTRDESFTINIPKAQGSGYSSVIIKRSGNGFVGPQGEYYSEFPKVPQLQAMYAK